MVNNDFDNKKNPVNHESPRKFYDEQHAVVQHETRRFHRTFGGESFDGVVGLNEIPKDAEREYVVIGNPYVHPLFVTKE